MRRFVVAAMIAAVPAAPVSAQEALHFQQCDGYPAPTRRGDGIVTGTFMFGLGKTREDFRRTAPQVLATAGLAACDRALADPTLKPEFLVRRAQLMQARAYHQIGAFAYDDALATLAAIDAQSDGLGGVLYDRGTSTGNRILRAWIFIETGKADEALAELSAIEAARPYSASLRYATLRLRLRLDPTLDNHLALLRAMAPTVPTASIEGMTLALQVGRFDDALAFGSGLTLDLPRARGGWTVEGQKGIEYQLIEARASIAGSLAYAMTATGRAQAAATHIAQARLELVAVREPPPTPPEGRRQSRDVLADYNTRMAHADLAEAELVHWEKLIALHQDAPEIGFDDVMRRIEGVRPGSVPVLADLLAHAGKEAEGDRAEVVSSLLAQLHEERVKTHELDLFSLMEILPRPETTENQVRFKRSGDGYFLSANGYSRRRMDGEDDWTVRFVDGVASAATVEEFGMLAAATEASRRGYDGMLLQSRRTLDLTTNVMGAYGGQVSTVNSGRESQLRVRLVKLNDLPADLAGSEWRVLDVAEVLAELSNLPQRPSG
jgi:hypothetical protein